MSCLMVYCPAEACPLTLGKKYLFHGVGAACTPKLGMVQSAVGKQ